MTVRRCSVEVYPSHWVPSVSVWTCDACDQEATAKGWPDDPPDGWYMSLDGTRVGEVRRHCCSYRCVDRLDGTWTKPPIGRHPVYSTFQLLRNPIRGFAVKTVQVQAVDAVNLPFDVTKLIDRIQADAAADAERPQLKGHRPECNEHYCFCVDPDNPDPMCECMEPGWMCRCAELAEDEGT